MTDLEDRQKKQRWRHKMNWVGSCRDLRGAYIYIGILICLEGVSRIKIGVDARKKSNLNIYGSAGCKNW